MSSAFALIHRQSGSHSLRPRLSQRSSPREALHRNPSRRCRSRLPRRHGCYRQLRRDRQRLRRFLLPAGSVQTEPGNRREFPTRRREYRRATISKIRHANRDSNRFALQVTLGRAPFPIDGSIDKPAANWVQAQVIDPARPSAGTKFNPFSCLSSFSWFPSRRSIREEPRKKRKTRKRFREERHPQISQISTEEFNPVPQSICENPSNLWINPFVICSASDGRKKVGTLLTSELRLLINLRKTRQFRYEAR